MNSPTGAPANDFRWSRALLHVGIAVVVFALITGALAAAFGVADPRRFGEGVGRFLVFMSLGTVGVSWLAQTGRKLAAIVTGGLLTALVIGLASAIAIVSLDRADAPARVPTADLARGGGTLRHPTLGFSIPDPGPNLAERPELASAQLPPTADSRAWVYGDEDSGEAVIIILASEAATDEKTFEEFFAGVVRGQTKAMADSALTADERERWVRWGQRRAHAYLVVAELIHLRVDAFGLTDGHIVVLATAAADGERFATLADGVQVP